MTGVHCVRQYLPRTLFQVVVLVHSGYLPLLGRDTFGVSSLNSYSLPWVGLYSSANHVTTLSFFTVAIVKVLDRTGQCLTLRLVPL